ncbi:MAG: hypothetical protein DIZ80_12975 [endosymbiont of Galathealinum brachiosum]|uniref:Sulfotransferase domain-containing protein n=1 Tax=endosymbiont of Galathealinum brachiosum TaxID=2200906 RepID=A0A370D7X8_9GAMM|nr:MAG: hypothetical protein DIZ80_12975 [endosymbiont of Galathealinum brachiosum]
MFRFLWLRRFINKYIRTRPGLFIAIMSKRSKFKNIIVNKDTEIVIEGYPRSANTFAVAAFNYSQNRKVVIGRHTHAPAQIMSAVAAGLPVILLIRKPMDAIISLAIRDETISLKNALKTYIWYHQSILPIIDGCVIADFNQVTNDFSSFINEVNIKYKTEYSLFDHNKESEKNIFKLVEDMEIEDSGGGLRESHVARPSDSRKNIKQEFKQQLELPENTHLLMECSRLYERITTS